MDQQRCSIMLENSLNHMKALSLFKTFQELLEDESKGNDIIADEFDL